MRSAFRIKSSPAASFAQRHLGQISRERTDARSKLASGSRINKAADDAAGLAVSEKLRTSIRGLEKSRQNIQNAISMIQTSEGAYQEIQSKLNRLKELAVQAASDGLTDSDRQHLEREADAITDEIDRMRDTVEYNGIKLLAGQKVDTDPNYWSNTDLWKKISDKIESGGGTVDISASIAAAGINTPYGTSESFAEMDGNLTDPRTDLKKGFEWWSDRLEAAAGVELNVDWKEENTSAPEATGASSGTPLDSGPRNNFTSQGNAGQFRFVAEDGVGPGAAVTWTANNPQDMNSSLQTTGNTYLNPNFNWGDDDDTSNHSLRWGAIHTVGLALGFPQLNPGEEPDSIMNPVSGTGDRAADYEGRIEEDAVREHFNLEEPTRVGSGSGKANFHVGPNRDEVIKADFQRVDSRSLGIWCVDLTSRERAERSIEKIEDARKKLSELRSKQGATINRLESTLDSTDLRHEKSRASVSRIRDADMAEQTTRKTRADIIAQAGTSVLGQIKTNARMALSLIG